MNVFLQVGSCAVSGVVASDAQFAAQCSLPALAFQGEVVLVLDGGERLRAHITYLRHRSRVLAEAIAIAQASESPGSKEPLSIKVPCVGTQEACLLLQVSSMLLVLLCCLSACDKRGRHVHAGVLQCYARELVPQAEHGGSQAAGRSCTPPGVWQHSPPVRPGPWCGPTASVSPLLKAGWTDFCWPQQPSVRPRIVDATSLPGTGRLDAGVCLVRLAYLRSPHLCYLLANI